MNARHKGAAKLWLLNLFGNAALLTGVYCFLVLPDAHRSQVAASALLALIVAFGGLWLRAGSFAYFRVADFRDAGCVWRAFRHALRHIIALLIWMVPIAVIEWLLFRCLVYAPQFGVWFWQKVPALRFGSPRAIFHVTEWFTWIAMVLLAIVWLPVASTVAAAGLKPSRMWCSWRLLKRGSYWLWCCVLGFAGGYLPYKVVWWIPALDTLKAQAWSAGLRFLLAYVLLISAWVALLLVIGDRLSQIDPIGESAAKPPA